MKLSKVLVGITSMFLLVSCSSNAFPFFNNNIGMHNANTNETYTATFYVKGEVYSQIQYTKDNYQTKVAPELPEPEIDHFNYWYPNVDFSIFEDTKYDCMETISFAVKHGGLAYDEGVFTATSDNTLGIYHNQEIDNGTISVTLSKAVKAEDSGIIFGLTYQSDTPETMWEEKGISYYFVFYSQSNNLVLSKITDGSYAALEYKETGLTDLSVDLKVSFDNGFIQCYLNDKCYIKYHEDRMLSGDKVGIRLGKGNASFSHYVVSNTPEPEADDIPGFLIEQGKASMVENKITIEANDTLLLARNAPIYNRKYQYIFVPNAAQTYGIILGYKDNEDDYFFYYIDPNGVVTLSYFDGVNNNVINSYTIPSYSVNKRYNLAVSVLSKKLTCSIDGTILFKYVNDESFVDSYFGLKCELSGTVIYVM